MKDTKEKKEQGSEMQGYNPVNAYNSYRGSSR